MNARRSSGFTIIETVLFLAVTGLMIAGALIGTGVALNNQRYRDSVETFKNLLQSQYDELGSIKNDREGLIRGCLASGLPDTGSGGSLARGQADCMVAGRLMLVDKGDISIYTVLATKVASQVSTNDIASMKTNYNYSVTPDFVDKRTMEWGTEIAWPAYQQGAPPRNPTPRSIAILFIRSPESGGVHTFTSDSVGSSSADIKAMMVAGRSIPGQGGRTICIEGRGMGTGGNRAVYISEFAAGASAIETRSNETILALGNSGLRC